MLKKKIITILIFAIGVIILLYPIVTKIISYNNQTIAISKYIKKVDNINKDEKEKYIEQTENYNKGIYEEDIFNTEEEKIDSIDASLWFKYLIITGYKSKDLQELEKQEPVNIKAVLFSKEG